MKDSNNEEKSNTALQEEEILKFWKENNVFEKSLEKDSPKGEYVFYEGPPTANGKPGIHHLEARAFKDVIPRYKTMCGYHVRRKGGWDTHGLPVELQVEKKLGLTSKKEIEEYGIAKFNKECKESVWEYTDLWEKFTDRIGYWVDQENAYVTYHNDYIESVWNVIKTVNDKKLLFKDYKVVPWCPRCGTGLSSHELAQGYQDVKDLSVYAKFKVKGQGNTYILAWTTTPWTLPGNVALAVGKDIKYFKLTVTGDKNLPSMISDVVKIGESYIASAEFWSRCGFAVEVFGNNVEAIAEDYRFDSFVDFKNLEYEPLYPFLKDTISDSEKPKLEKAFHVYPADFVTTEDGTGVVHTAVMYGQDDFALGNELGLPKHHLVGLDGKFLSGTGFLEGRFVRDEDVAVDIIKDLAHRGLLFKKEKYEHPYPHCWRCKTALIYYARDSWYIRMSSLRDELVKENGGINWEPSYIKEGRFGEWLRDIKDWAISRERYWGTPLPVWKCDKCEKIEVMGSIEDLKSKAKKSGNKYLLMRHGESEGNLNNLVSVLEDSDDHLTENGKKQVKESALGLKDKKIDLIFSSPIPRTKETAHIVAEELGFNKDDIIIDNRLREVNIPDYEGKTWQEFRKDFPSAKENFYSVKENNESYNDVKKRMMDFFYELEEKYKDKNILVVSHAGPIWLAIAGTMGFDAKESLDIKNIDTYGKNAEYRDLDFVPLPHNESYELDLHKPYIDEIELVCECGGNLDRTKEVMDVWLDSGTMPFSQDHYPFENREWVDGKGYPADFISEAIDQTRGWFYTLHAVGVLMGKGKAFKNVICLGHILDVNGKKMSKSLGNIVDPWSMMNKYGADTLRLWMYSVNQPGESKNFDEKTVAELNNKVFNLLYNVLAFYELYRDESLEGEEYKGSDNVLDQWIVSLLNQLIGDVTDYLENYKLLEPVRATRVFIDSLSTWYLRRSRERIKDGDKEAKQTLYYVLKTLSKMMAPFAPFAGEDIWQRLKNKNDKESVHLESWVKAGKVDSGLLEEMSEVREVVTLGLQERQKAGIPVRRPLGAVVMEGYKIEEKYKEIIKDELNIKEVKEYIANFEPLKLNIKIPPIKAEHLVNNKKIELDTNITKELKEEGQYRELVRAVQDIRKKNGLNPNDMISLVVKTDSAGESLVNQFKDDLLKTVMASEVQFKENEGVDIKIDDFVFVISILKV